MYFRNKIQNYYNYYKINMKLIMNIRFRLINYKNKWIFLLKVLKVYKFKRLLEINLKLATIL